MKSQKEEIIEAFKRNHFRMQLGHILKFPWGYEARARFSELRQEGYTITCEKAKKPSDNLYILIPPDKNGQTSFA